MSDGVPPTGQPDHAIFGVVSEAGPFKGYIIYPRWVREFIRRGVPSRFRGSAALLYLEVAQTIYADAKKLDYEVHRDTLARDCGYFRRDGKPDVWLVSVVVRQLERLGILGVRRMARKGYCLSLLPEPLGGALQMPLAEQKE